MSRYREIYNTLEKGRDNSFLGSGQSNFIDDMLREAGVDAKGTDGRDTGLAAAVIYLTERVRELELKARSESFLTDGAIKALMKKVEKLEKQPTERS